MEINDWQQEIDEFGEMLASALLKESINEGLWPNLKASRRMIVRIPPTVQAPPRVQVIIDSNREAEPELISKEPGGVSDLDEILIYAEKAETGPGFYFPIGVEFKVGDDETKRQAVLKVVLESQQKMTSPKD